MAVRVQTEDFDVGAESRALQADAVGAIALFVGTVRGMSSDNGVTAMTLEHYPGMTEDELKSEGRNFVVGVARYREIARGQILGDETGLFKMLFDRDTKALLGVHCIGTGATELVHVGQAALKLGGGLSYFLETVFNYPTLAECYKVAAFHAANKIGYLPESERIEY